MRIHLWETVAAGLIVVFGAIMAYVGASYGVGNLTRMGSGYFPLIVGILICIIGLVTMIEVRRNDAPYPEVSWRAFLCVFSGFLGWALFVERFGLFPASAFLIVMCTLARSPVRIPAMVLTAVLVPLAAVVVFLHGFRLPLHAVRW